MDLLLDSSVLGSKDHLLASEEGFLRTSKRQADVWHYTGCLKLDSEKCWDTVLRLSGSPVPQIPQKYVEAMKVVAPDLVSIPWSQVLPQRIYRAYLNDLVALRDKYDDRAIEYYSSNWIKGNELLRRLRPARTDGTLINELSSASVHNASVIESFRPRSGGYAAPITYDRFGTVTGRLVVESGPNILLLKKENKRVIRPSTPGGAIISLDFASLEARILLYESGGKCEGPDLYSDIASRLGGLSRSTVKAAILAELYGSSKNSLALTLGMSDTDLTKFIKMIGEVIDTRGLLRRLKSQFSAEGFITNRFGRKIEVSRPQDNIFVNYYAQSTGVDVALTGFNEILNRLGLDGIRPLFVLHDALILDVREDRISDVESMTSVVVPGYIQPFPLKPERV